MNPIGCVGIELPEPSVKPSRIALFRRAPLFALEPIP